EASLIQWPIVVLAGMRRLHLRKRPLVPPAVDWIVLALGGGLVFAAHLTEGGAHRAVDAFVLAAFAVNLYSAAIVSLLGDFRHSFALKALVAIEAGVAALEAVCLGFAAVGPADRDVAAVRLAAQVAITVASLGLVPIA